MSEEDARENPVLAWVQGHILASALIGLVSLIVLVLWVSSLGGGSDDITTAGVTTTLAGTDTTVDQEGTVDPNRPDVPQVDCGTLLDSDEVDVALFGEGATGSRGAFTLSQGETCLHQPNDDSGNYIQIEPGDPADFADDAQISGVFGEPVEGVGDGARWFDDGSDLGILSVGVNIEEASIIYRVHVRRSDLNGAQRLELARELALLALHRFPGTEPAAPEPLVDLCQLVSDAQAESILDPYRDAHPATRDEILVSDNFSDLVDLSEEGDANCHKLILAEIYIETQQGSPSDFEAGATMEGVAAEPVTGVGDEAVWFADVPYQGSFTAPHERGVLAVRVGDAFFRIVIAVPETPSSEQLEIVKGLATGAVGQIPGVAAQESILTEQVPTDLPPQDYAANLLARVEVGDWSLGDGLVATLGMLVGEVDVSDVITGPPPNDGSALPVVALAREYVESDPDGEATAEITRLIGLLTPSRVQIEEWAEPADTTANAQSLLVSLLPLAQEEQEEELQEGGQQEGEQQGEEATPSFCESEFGVQPKCLVPESYPDLDGERYVLFRPKAELNSGWTLTHIDLAHEAMLASVNRLEPLGEMPRVSLMLGGVHEEALAGGFSQSTGGWTVDGECTITLSSVLQPEEGNAGEAQKFQQHIALRMTQCFLSNGSGFTTGWSVGASTYLADVIYKDASLEVESSPKFGWDVSNPDYLAGSELKVNAVNRGSTNWALYEYIADEAGGPEGVLATASGFPTSLDPYLHDYNLELTDGVIHDVAGTHGYEPPASRLDVFGPTQQELTPATFGLKRLRVVVQPGKYACLDTSSTGNVQVSWRPGSPGNPGAWVDEPPETIEGESVFVVTALRAGASFSLDVTDVGDNPDCEQEEEGGDVIGPVQELCEDLCDPSSYYWGPLRFN